MLSRSSPKKEDRLYKYFSWKNGLVILVVNVGNSINISWKYWQYVEMWEWEVISKITTFQSLVDTANGVKYIIISDVLLEVIQSMLISVSMMCGYKFSINFRSRKCTLHDPHGQTIEVMKKAGENLFWGSLLPQQIVGPLDLPEAKDTCTFSDEIGVDHGERSSMQRVVALETWRSWAPLTQSLSTLITRWWST